MKTFRALRHRNYRLYFTGQLISLIGSWMQVTAMMWLAFDLTHESKWPAFLMVAMIGPTLVLGAWAGALADRCRKHSLIVSTQIGFLLSATILTCLVYARVSDIGMLLVLMLGHGIIQAIDLPTRLSFVPDLVERDDLRNAIALNSLQFNVARAIGPALAGFALTTMGPAFCFLLNALSYVSVLVALGMMRDIPVRPPATQRNENQSSWAVVRSNPYLFYLILLAGWMSITGWPLLALLPAFAEKMLTHSAGDYSSLLSSVGLGALLAALTTATYANEKRQHLILFMGVVLVAGGLIGLSLARELLAAGCCAGVYGYGMILFFATGQGVVQLGTKDEHRGKVMGIWAMMLGGGAPMGNLVLGPAADRWGVTTIIMVEAGAVLLAALLILLILGLRWYRRSS